MTTRLVTRTCPTGCGRAVSSGKLMCLPCWREVPKHLQREVYRTWKAYTKDPTDDAFEAYDAARENALGAIA